MTDKFIVIKNGLVLTLDRKKQTGYYNIVIKNGKIFLVDYEKKFNEKEFKSKNPDAEIIDAKDKLIMPGLFNSKLVSSYSLNKFFLKKCTYENISNWLSLKLVDKFLSGIENAETFRDLLKIIYMRSIQNGEIFINESSFSLKKDFFDIYFSNSDWIKQYYNLTAFDNTILSDLENIPDILSMGFKTDEDVNNYSISSIKKYLSGNTIKLFIESSLSQNAFDSIRKVFGKPLITVLAENELISPGTILYNPTHLSPAEIETLAKRNSCMLISPSDYLNLSSNKIDYYEFAQSGLNIMIGTGYSGNDILSELKLFASIISKSSISYEWLMQTAIYNPSVIFGISNITGSIERNKSADLIFFDLKDLRNTLTLPEITSENICEFIIENLTVKDISEVLLKGEFFIQEKKDVLKESEELQFRAKEISAKIYSEGKYFEYKEKYLMRGRVDKLSLNNRGEEADETRREEIFVDMTETGEYTGEGEFTILGTKKEDFEKPRGKDKKEQAQKINLKEIKSLEKEMNLFDEEYEIQEFENPKIEKKKTVSERPVKKTPEEQSEERVDTKQEKENAEIPVNEDETSEPLFQKGKLKFGFKEDGE